MWVWIVCAWIVLESLYSRFFFWITGDSECERVSLRQSSLTGRSLWNSLFREVYQQQLSFVNNIPSLSTVHRRSNRMKSTIVFIHIDLKSNVFVNTWLCRSSLQVWLDILFDIRRLLHDFISLLFLAQTIRFDCSCRKYTANHFNYFIIILCLNCEIVFSSLFLVQSKLIVLSNAKIISIFIQRLIANEIIYVFIVMCESVCVFESRPKIKINKNDEFE